MIFNRDSIEVKDRDRISQGNRPPLDIDTIRFSRVINSYQQRSPKLPRYEITRSCSQSWKSFLFAIRNLPRFYARLAFSARRSLYHILILLFLYLLLLRINERERNKEKYIVCIVKYIYENIKHTIDYKKYKKARIMYVIKIDMS